VLDAQDEEPRTPVFAVLTPFAAQWLLNRLEGGAAFRAGQAWALQQGRPELARQLGHALAQLQASARCYEPPPASASGSAEVPPAVESPDSKSPPEDWWPTQRVADELRVSPRQVTNLIKEKKLTATWVGRQWLVDPKSVSDELLRRSA
jgi:hypothetical protein